MPQVQTHILNPTDLRYLLIDNLNLYTENSYFLDGKNPYNFSVNKKSIFIYLKNTHSSGNGRGNSDELRIQVGNSENFLTALNSGKLVFFLGYSDDYGTFTAWNPVLCRERINKRTTVSFYTRISTQEKAKNQGISIYTDANGQKIISFRPEYIGVYLENYNLIHQSTEESLLELIKKSDSVESTGESGEEFNINEEYFKLTKTRTSRDPNFRKIVCNAYRDRCAITGIQLNLVEAAHIIPHSHELGTDDIKNGICLSSLHHAAYDSGLIYFDEEYNIKINQEKVRYLEKTGKDGGLLKFRDMLYDSLKLPEIETYYPSKEYIMIANKIRGINL